MDNMWAYDIEMSVYSIVKAIAKPKLIEKYPKIYFTQKSKSTKTPTFPTVYIHLLPPTEEGKTIDGQSINALSVTFQVDVITNKDESEARYVMSVVSEVFKKLRFGIKGFPSLEFGDTNKSTARFQRIIGANEKLV